MEGGGVLHHVKTGIVREGEMSGAICLCGNSDPNIIRHYYYCAIYHVSSSVLLLCNKIRIKPFYFALKLCDAAAGGVLKTDAA